ncbi:hypothetical protein CUN38_04905 [Enterococcus faecium]|uniref:hypothetical protein n=1 Tax=Enterococcus faecium TaxID=1352 RepID=UPI000CF0C44E|nr:hypothetical protein [Enterococcus faecium]PQC93483.1 hypothetical protein CUN38_04905 [Enterococcus faecium]
MEPFTLINDYGKEIMVGVTVDGKISVVIDPEPLGVSFNWQTIHLTEDEAKAVRRALMTAIAESKKG